MGNIKWRSKYPEAIVKDLVRKHSDHNPLLLELMKENADIRSRPFRFEIAWISHPSFWETVAKAWEGERDIGSKLKLFQERIQEWNCKVFGNIFRQ